MNHQEYDYIIAGAGAAGLSLLWHLIQSKLLDGTILVIDSNLDSTPDKTWCFWDESHPFLHLSKHNWNTVEVFSNGQKFIKTLPETRYYCLRSDRYHETVLQAAIQKSYVTFIEAEILEIDEDPSRGVVKTDAGTFYGTWIFQSVFAPANNDDIKSDNSLLQHFVGWDIETFFPVFNPDTVTLMDFDTEQKDGITFYYLLPFTTEKAMIEYTLFSDSLLPIKEYEEAIRQYLKVRFHLNEEDYRITRKEKGSIPMEDKRYPEKMNARTLNIGIAGGLAKPSTGYTFTRIHKHSRHITRALELNKKPTTGESSYRFRVYDIMLLYLLKHEVSNAREAFHQLFRNNDMELVFKFLDEKTHFGEELLIFSRMPAFPFLRSIYKMKHRILTGA